MAKINVDYSSIEAAAVSIERYCAEHRRRNHNMEEELLRLGEQWRGKDYQQVLLQWQQLDAPTSESGQLLRELEAQARLLRWAAERYESVQNTAISRAKRLSQR